MPVPAMQNWEIGGRDADWNGSDARRRVVDFYTKDGVTDWNKVHKAFFHYETDKAETKTGHNLGYVDIVGGTPKAMPHGIFAVAGGHGVTSLQSATSEEKTKIKKQVNRWYKRMKKKWPNDDFDFDPPFPDVKEESMPSNRDSPRLPDEVVKAREDMRQELTKAVDRIKEHLETKFIGMGLGNATSFADLAAIDAIWETIDKVFKTVYDFQFLAENAAWTSDSPNEMLSTVKSITLEMVEIFDQMAKEVPGSTQEIEDQNDNDKGLTRFINSDGQEKDDWTIKQRGSGALLKNSDGEQFFYGRFTNNIWDKDGEVLITEAHQEFVDYLDSHPDEAPELWDWHEEDTAKTHKAVWWDFSDGFLHAIWPVTDKEAQGIEAFMKEFDPGMSHGFKVLERKEEDNNQIALYRTKEASILDLQFAANEWTTFDLLDALKSLEPEERCKMFSPEKQRALELLSLGEYKTPLGKASEADAAALDESGVQRKETTGNDPQKGSDGMNDKTDVKKEEDAPDAQPATTTTTTQPEQEIDLTALDALQSSIVEGFDLLNARFTALETQVNEQGKELDGIKKTKGQSPSVAAWVAAQKAGTAVGATQPDGLDTDDGQVKDDDPLLGTGPEEAAFDVDGHLLEGL